ncbi:MAG: ATP-binding protein [Pseudomonadota bacterium]
MVQSVSNWWANRPLATKGLVVVAVPLLIFLGSVAALYSISRMESRAEQDVRLTIAIQNDVNEVHALLAEASSGVRGYLLTGEPRFLEPYDRAEQLVPQVTQRLRGSIRDAEASVHLARIEALASQKREGLSQLVAARRRTGADVVSDPTITAGLGANKQVLDALRGEIEGMQERERELLAARQDRLDRVRFNGLVITGLLTVAGLVGSLFAVFLFSSGIVRRVQRLERDAVLLAQGEALEQREAGRDEIGLLAVRMTEASALLRAREQALREGEERFRLVIEGVRDYGIFALDPDGKVISWNTGAERIKGWTSDEILGRHFSTFYPGDDAHDRSMRNLAEAVRDGRMEDEGWRVRKDGTLFWANVVITALRDEAGELRGFSKVTRDITERRRAQEALEHARQEAEQASTAKSLFLSRMSHELRTPLNAILGFAQLLELDHSGRGKTDAASIDQILRAGRHLLALIDEVLDIARIEAGKLGMEIVPVALSGTISEAVGLSLPEAESHRIAIRHETAHLAPVAADRRRLLQVLLNLLSNAIKYNRPGGEVVITAQVAGERVRVEVVDSGIGVDPGQAGELFQPFTRLAAGAARTEGTGLGLSLSRALIEAMGGSIGYAPRFDGHDGACFWFELPLTAQSKMPDLLPARPPLPNHTAPCPLTILVVEDNLANAQLIEAVAARHWPEARILHAMQARLGLDLALRHSPDLVLLDLHLPDRDGDWVLRELGASFPDLPVILLTADALAAQADWTSRGAAAVLTKPIDVPSLLEVVELALMERTS